MPPKNRISRKARDKVEQVSAPDALEKKANEALDDETLKDRSSTREMREKYAGHVFWYLVSYSLTALAVLVLQGWHIGGFQLDTTVMAILVGSTAASAIGLVGFVVKGLFR
jgi:hypothetical protein